MMRDDEGRRACERGGHQKGDAGRSLWPLGRAETNL